MNSLRCLALFSALAPLAAPLAAQTWQQNANGQLRTVPCTGQTFNFPVNSNWIQQEVVATCGTPPQSYLAQPSNWSTPQYPNSTGAAVTINGPTVPTLDVSVLVNSVTIGPAGGLNLDNQGRLTGQSLVVQRDVTITRSANQGGSGGDIFLTRDLTKTAGPGALVFEPTAFGGVGLNLTGALVNVQSGRIVFPGRGTILGANFQFAGPGNLVDLTGGGSTRIAGSLASTSTVGTVLFANGALSTGATDPATGQLSTPTLNFSGDVFQWTGGQLLNAGTGLVNNGVFNVSGAGDKNVIRVPITNNGTLALSGAGRLTLDQFSDFTNSPAGTIDARGDGSIGHTNFTGGTFPTIYNSGLFVKSAGAGAFALDPDVSFSNRGGTVRADAGTIVLSQGNTIDGTYVTSAGTVIDLTGGSNAARFSGTLTGSGAGTVRVATGVFAPGSLDATPAQLAPVLNFPGNLFQWTGGTIGAGRTNTVTNNGVLNSTVAAKRADNVILVNNGTMNFAAGNVEFYRSAIQNNASGLVDIQADLTFSGENFSVTNAGTFRKSAGSGTATVDVILGFTNAGRVEVSSGRLDFGLNFGGFTQSGGAVVLANGGSIALDPRREFVFTGGALVGTGTVAGSVRNAGALTIGSADATPSAISISGNYVQNAGSVLTANIGGVGAGSFGMLTVSGSATINGTLTLNLVNGFKLRAGDSFRVIAAASSSGSFSAVNFPAGVTGSVSSSGGAVTVTITSAPPAASLINLSTRARIETGNNVLIGGFVIAGTQPKRVVIRALGPSLLAAGVPGALSNPTLTVFNAQRQPIAQNDNWRSDQPADLIASGRAPTDEREAAVILALPPGGYTAIVSGVGGEMGVGLIEVYDLDPAGRETARPINVSTRARVLTGDNVLIGGFVVGGVRPRKVIIRALGPSLAAAGVQGTLPDPTLTVYNAQSRPVASNDDWRATQQVEIQALGLQPPDERESALVLALDPGAYTAIVSGKNGQSGVALVEVYDLE